MSKNLPKPPAHHFNLDDRMGYPIHVGKRDRVPAEADDPALTDQDDVATELPDREDPGSRSRRWDEQD